MALPDDHLNVSITRRRRSELRKTIVLRADQSYGLRRKLSTVVHSSLMKATMLDRAR